MSRPRNHISLSRFAAAVLSVSLTCGISAVSAVSAQTQTAASDADVQSNVAYALLHTPQLQGQAITAATINGEVTLSGVVKDNATKQMAEQVVSGTGGVSAVHDNLTIGDPAAALADQEQQDDQQAQPPMQQNEPTPSAAPQAPSAPAAPSQPAVAGMPPPPPIGNPSQQEAIPNQQEGNRPPYQGAPPAYRQQQQQPASGPVTVPAGTLLRIRTSEPLDVKHVQPGTMFEATAAGDIYEGGVIAIPRGATLEGEVVAAKASGAFAGKPELQLKLTTLNLEGRTYPVVSDIWSSQGPSKSGYTAANTAGGAVVGALLGAFIGGGPGAAVGAVAGGVGGASIAGATQGPRMLLPPETVLNFHLSTPVTVQPVSYQEAERLASTQSQPPPQLRRRPVYYAAPPPYYYYPYYPMYYGYYGR